MLRALRPHQWAKNLLIFLPLLLAHVIAADRLLTALLAFCCFSLTASSAYIVNDLLDIEADRRHPQKRLRPFATGDLSAFAGLGIVAVFSAPGALGRAPAARGVLRLAASLSGRPRWPIPGISSGFALVDVLVLSGLYTLRLLAGSAATSRTSRTGWPASRSSCSSLWPSSSALPS